MLVPVVAEVGKDKKASLGRVPVSEDGGRFKFTTTERPKRLAIDEDNLLAISAAVMRWVRIEQLLLPRRPAERPPAKQVEVEVEDGLARPMNPC